MKMDISNGVYLYYEQQPFTFQTTYDTHAHMDIALEVVSKFKVCISRFLKVSF